MTTNYYIKRGIINESKHDVYCYGFEVFLSTLVYTIIFIVTAIISKTLVQSLLFWLGFFIIRKICGGYHAKTYWSCHLIFFTNHIIFIVLYKHLPGSLFNLLSLVCLLISSILIFLFAPIAPPNKPFIKNERGRFRKYSCVYSVLLLLLLLLKLFIPVVNNNTFSFSIGSFSAAIALLLGKYIK